MRKERLHILPINWTAESGKRSVVKLLVAWKITEEKKAELERLKKERGEKTLYRKRETELKQAKTSNNFFIDLV